MKTIKISILAWLFALLFVGSSFSGNLVTEPPVNIVGWNVNYDYRESDPPYWYPGNNVGETMFVGSEGASGGYFFLVALINPGLGSCLTAHSQIRKVKAEWLGEPPYEFSLVPDTCLNQLFGHPYFTKTQAWALALRPAVWQFEEPWKFTLTYDCNGQLRKQTREVQPNPPDTIPPKPSGILIEKVGEYFNVSWIGMGNPSNHPFGYRVTVHRDEDNCPIGYFGTGYGPWSYADGPNRITVNVPIAHAGKVIRIENRNNYGMPGPPFPPGTLGAAPNRALIRTRLPE
jgi:hypothetical protein